MKLSILLALAPLASCTVVPSAQRETPIPGRPSHQVAIYLGERDLDDVDYAPSDDQTTVGVEYSSQTPGYPVGFEVGILSSYEGDDDGSGDDFDVGVFEAFGGVRKTWGAQNIRPYLAGGVSLIAVSVENDSLGVDDDDDDGSLAGYVRGGVMFFISELVYVALDARAVFGSDIDIRSTTIEDADYEQISVMLGFSF